FLRSHSSLHQAKVLSVTHSAFNRWTRFYEKSLSFVIAHPRGTFAAFVAMTALTAWLFVTIPKGFMPTEDIDQIFGMTEGVQGISFNDLVRHQKELAEIALSNPNVACIMSTVGAGGPNVAGNTGRIFMRLKPRATRRQSADEIIKDLRPKFAKVPGIKIFL